MASFDGEISPRTAQEGGARVPTVIVHRFVGVRPGQTCERAMSNASLAPQYWRIETLRGEAVKGIEGKGIRFTPGATTVVGCPPPLGDLEGTLLSVLGAARTWAIHGQVLEIFEASGASIATLEAVYLG